MAQIFISLGSSIKRKYHVKQGIYSLANSFSISLDKLTLSSLFESEAVGFTGENFYNMVIGVQCSYSVEEVATILKDIESLFGRPKNAKKFSPRTLDLDLLLYDDLIINTPAQLPRDEINENAFVLWPLSEVAPEVIHPILNINYATLWKNYNKQSQHIKRIPNCW
jgi:2-amino-4-hydroxy-6-hydroxymethyldihydropteridine diphosphokinase|tara:strand:+ start:1171 stop:1668 length:498 start_codon:yes stop_codon:yes gene_type:complete